MPAGHDALTLLKWLPPPSMQPSSFPHLGRRTVISLLTVSLAGLLSGTGSALAQRVWEQHRGSPAPLATPFAQPPALTLWHPLRLLAHTATVRALAWSPDGASLCSGAEDALLLLWRPDGMVKERVRLPHAVRSLAWSPDGTRLAAASGAAVAFVEVQTGQVLAFPQAHRAAVTSVCWSAQAGSPVVSGSLDRQAILWQTQQYQPQGFFTKHTTAIEAVTASPGVSTIIASASQGGVIRLWDLQTLQEIHGFSQDGAVALPSAAFAPDGMRLAVGGQDGIVRLWERSLICEHPATADGEPRCADVPVRLQGSHAAVRALAWSPDGRYLAAGGDDAQVRVWESLSQTHVATLIHDAPVHALSWSPSQPMLATASGNVVQIWKVQIT